MVNVDAFGGHSTFPQKFPPPYPSTFSSWLILDLFLLGRDIPIDFWSLFFCSLTSVPDSDIPPNYLMVQRTFNVSFVMFQDAHVESKHSCLSTMNLGFQASFQQFAMEEFIFVLRSPF